MALIAVKVGFGDTAQHFVNGSTRRPLPDTAYEAGRVEMLVRAKSDPAPRGAAVERPLSSAEPQPWRRRAPITGPLRPSIGA